MNEQPPVIVSVVDTRDYMELDDRWVAIPGSGITLECERCGRGHEVHVTVEYADGTSKVVGTGCAERGEAYGRKVASAAGTVARNRAKVRQLEAHLIAASAAERAARLVSMPTPSWEPGTTEGTRWLVAGPARVLVNRHADVAEREAALARVFADRYAQVIASLAGFAPLPAHLLTGRLDDARRQLRTAEARLATLH